MSRAYTKPEHFGISPAPGGGFISLREPRGPDSEGRWPIEGYGLPVFAWRPRRCRNGRVRWLRWLERHSDGTYTLCDRMG